MAPGEGKVPKNFTSDEKISANAMDTTWGGSLYSEQMVEKGVYAPDSRKGNDQNPYKQSNMTFRNRIYPNFFLNSSI